MPSRLLLGRLNGLELEPEFTDQLLVVQCEHWQWFHYCTQYHVSIYCLAPISTSLT